MPLGPSHDRRGALSRIAKTLLGVLGTAVAAPGLAFLADPLRRRGTGTAALRVAAASAVRPGRPLYAEIVGTVRDAWSKRERERLGACWLVRDGERIRALSTVCPHLGCAVDWQEEARAFHCPCHRSTFDEQGRRKDGPAPRDMDELEARVAEDGGVLVVHRRFRIGTPRG